MNTQRIVVLGLAVVAACGAAFLARGLFGGGTPKVDAKPTPPPIAMSQVMVASVDLQPGQALTPALVRWQKWPSASVAPSFVTAASGVSIADAIKGTVVRAPMVAGEPVTSAKIVHANAGGFMAATLTPGMRAVSITITTDSGAGGFILPNDRVDLILTQKSNESPPSVHAKAILSDIRVLAIDQTMTQDKDQKAVIGKTATLELTPTQAIQVARAEEQGTLSLSLRALGDTDPATVASAAPSEGDNGDAASVSIIRYGVTRADTASGSQKEGQ